MEYTPLSPFKRPITRAHLRVVEEPEASVFDKPVNKWTVLRDLSRAQAAFGLRERDLTVLQGLLSFLPEDELRADAQMIVFASNRTICERLNGMPCSTMRRHLARLVDAGFLSRRDSPNGKRYVRRHGPERVAFGFDLAPLHCRFAEIARAADAVRDAENRATRLREIVRLMRRDLAALAAFGEEMQPGLGLWDQLRDAAILTARTLRRKLSIEELRNCRDRLSDLLDTARKVIDGSETEEMGTSDARNEQHQHSSKKDLIDSEPDPRSAPEPELVPECQPMVEPEAERNPKAGRAPKVPLHLVTTTCPTLKTFYPGEIRHWHQLHDAACHIRPSMGIDLSVWQEAQRQMGPEQASVVIAAMLERFSEIRSPGAYLRTLTSKAASGAFSCAPMIMALTGHRSAA